MSAAELLADLRRRGLSVWAEGSALWVQPRAQIPAELRPAIVAAKSEILALLATERSCQHCHKPLDAKRCCWKCQDRLCACGKHWTGSAFIELCLYCEAEYRRKYPHGEDQRTQAAQEAASPSQGDGIAREHTAAPAPAADGRPAAEAKAEPPAEPWREIPLADLDNSFSEWHVGLPSRAMSALATAGIKSVGQLEDYRAGEVPLTDIDGIATKTAEGLEEALGKFWEKWNAAHPPQPIEGAAPETERTEEAE